MLLSQLLESGFRVGCMAKDDGVRMFCVPVNMIYATFGDFESFLERIGIIKVDKKAIVLKLIFTVRFGDVQAQDPSAEKVAKNGLS